VQAILRALNIPATTMWGSGKGIEPYLDSTVPVFHHRQDPQPRRRRPHGATISTRSPAPATASPGLLFISVEHLRRLVLHAPGFNVGRRRHRRHSHSATGRRHPGPLLRRPRPGPAARAILRLQAIRGSLRWQISGKDLWGARSEGGDATVLRRRPEIEGARHDRSEQADRAALPAGVRHRRRGHARADRRGERLDHRRRSEAGPGARGSWTRS
jgi:hypothetical protein